MLHYFTSKSAMKIGFVNRVLKWDVQYKKWSSVDNSNRVKRWYLKRKNETHISSFVFFLFKFYSWYSHSLQKFHPKIQTRFDSNLVGFRLMLTLSFLSLPFSNQTLTSLWFNQNNARRNQMHLAYSVEKSFASFGISIRSNAVNAFSLNTSNKSNNSEPQIAAHMSVFVSHTKHISTDLMEFGGFIPQRILCVGISERRLNYLALCTNIYFHFVFGSMRRHHSSWLLEWENYISLIIFSFQHPIRMMTSLHLYYNTLEND